jgi:hypothetical protein
MTIPCCDYEYRSLRLSTRRIVIVSTAYSDYPYHDYRYPFLTVGTAITLISAPYLGQDRVLHSTSAHVQQLLPLRTRWKPGDPSMVSTIPLRGTSLAPLLLARGGLSVRGTGANNRSNGY